MSARTSKRGLSVAEEQLCLLMEYAPASIAMFNLEMEYLAATRRWRETFRLGDEEIFGRSHYEVVPWIPAQWKAEYQRCLAGEALKWEQDYLERPDGTSDWLLREMHPWFDETAAVGGIIVFNEIITERKRSADDLECNRRLLKAVLENIQDGIIACDANGEMLVCNPAARRMHVPALESVPTQKWAEHYRLYEADGKTPLTKERIPLFRALHGQVVRDEEFMIDSSGAAPRSVVVSSQPLFMRDGAAIGAVASIHDITERREIEARYFQAQKMEAVGQLTGGLAHDFNNLLAVIIGNLQLLQRAPEDREKLERRVEAAIAAAQRGADLTARLLAVAHRQTLAVRPVDANALIAGLEDLLSRTLGELIEVQTRLEDELWTISIDDSQLEAAILNLAINARDAMQTGGRLTIGTRRVTFCEEHASQYGLAPGDYVMISISDTGSGMSEETRSRAIEPFFTTKEAGKGSGLGLSIVYGFVRQSGGQLQIDSEQGRGTTVAIYFPRSSATPERRNEPPSTASEIGDRSKRILVVEDDTAVRDVAVALLEDLGYWTAAARDGDTALRLLQTSPNFDLLLTDVVMPGRLNGPALANAARELLPDIKVLFTSGYAGSAVIADSIPGGVELVRKPFRREELALKVKQALRGPAAKS